MPVALCVSILQLYIVQQYRHGGDSVPSCCIHTVLHTASHTIRTHRLIHGFLPAANWFTSGSSRALATPRSAATITRIAKSIWAARGRVLRPHRLLGLCPGLAVQPRAVAAAASACGAGASSCTTWAARAVLTSSLVAAVGGAAVTGGITLAKLDWRGSGGEGAELASHAAGVLHTGWKLDDLALKVSQQNTISECLVCVLCVCVGEGGVCVPGQGES